MPDEKPNPNLREQMERWLEGGTDAKEPHRGRSGSSLSEEEKHRIIEEEKARLLAQQAIKTKQSQQQGCVVLIAILIVAWLGSFACPKEPVPSASSTTQRGAAETSLPLLSNEPQLELITYNWHREYDYAILEGQVKNISSKTMEHVEAVAIFFDSSNTFITSDDTLITYDPLLPGQTSPFKVMATWNPEMKKANVEFKYLFGGTIVTRRLPNAAR